MFERLVSEPDGPESTETEGRKRNQTHRKTPFNNFNIIQLSLLVFIFFFFVRVLSTIDFQTVAHKGERDGALIQSISFKVEKRTDIKNFVSNF